MGRVLVAGASGNFGAAAAHAFSAAGWEVRRYTRGTDMAAAAIGCDLIVNALNPPKYHDWARLIPAITMQVLAAAKVSGATVLVIGNVYVYGQQPGPWGADTPHRPCSRKGAIRAEMEARYKASGLPVIVLRGGDFLEAGSNNTFLNMVTLKGLEKGKFQVAGDPGVPRAYAHLPDMARVAVALAEQRASLPRFADVPYAGLTFSMADLKAEFERQTGRNLRYTRLPWATLRLLSPFWELARELIEMRYLYDLPHGLDAGVLAALLPNHRDRTLRAIVAAHLAARAVV
jgi:nucleoside-diphosphate-sugar epimerase